MGDGGWAVSFHICINYVLIFIVVVYSNVQICYCFLIGEKSTIKETDFPPNKGCSVAGMWMQHLSCVSTSQSFRVLWYSTVLKQ